LEQPLLELLEQPLLQLKRLLNKLRRWQGFEQHM
jgi:hypothetical protein